LPNPTITASARPYNADYTAVNLFDSALAEYATAGQGAVSAPFTTDPNNGTWVQFDFGATVALDRFVMSARQNGADVVGTSRLIVSSDPTFDNSDTIFTFNPSGANGAGIIRNLGSVSGRYVRWEVLTSIGTSPNLGGMQMWFLNTPSGHVLLPPPTAINSSTPFNGNFIASQAVNGDAGDGPTSEYASHGVGANMFIDFDFGAAVSISGFDFWNRWYDRVTTFNLVFANSSDFSSPIATLPFTADANGNQVNSATFAAVTAQFVRLQATGAAGGNNTGVREIQFYTPAGQRPIISQQPQGGAPLAGDPFTLSVAAGGDTPLFFQWFNGNSPVDRGTNALLTFSKVQASDSGSYSVIISNVYGSVTSSPPAVLTVIDSPVDITSDLKAWYNLDEGTFLVAYDVSGNGNDGTLQGFVDDDSQWVTGRINGGLKFNPAGSGVNEVVVVPGGAGQLDFSSNPEFTLSAWVKAPGVQEDGAALIAKGTGGGGEQYTIDVYGGTYRFFVRAASGEAVVAQGSVRPNGLWQHVVAVYGRTLARMKLYVNTTEVASSAPFGTDLLANPHDISLGARQLNTSDYDLNLNGVLDDVRVYARALTPSDISALYYDAPVGPPIVQSIIADANGITLTFQGIAGVEYHLLRATEVAGPWTPLTVVTPGPDGSAQFIDAMAPPDAGFYQLVYP